MRILVVFTGGTIGSQITEKQAIDVSRGRTRLLLAQYADRGPLPASFDVLEPLNILSENATPNDWNTLVRAIRDVDVTSYDGIVVTHGTDTLAYASAALSFALHDVPIPLVMVASNHPLDDVRANGFHNFCDAVRLIHAGVAPGVYVTYVNPDGRHLVHHGARLTDATPLAHYFRSIGHSEFAEFRGGRLVALTDDDPGAMAGPGDPAVAWSRAERGDAFSGTVLLVRPYPGLDYRRLDLHGVDAVVHDLYHSGTACVVPEPAQLSLAAFAQRCAEARVPLFVAPWPAGASLYESSHSLMEEGAVSLVLMAASAAYAKVMRGLGLDLEGAALRAFVADRALAREFVHTGQGHTVEAV
jgi:L-asparaginase/Glu-tRNA(Gln) amidotransferase subunit D